MYPVVRRLGRLLMLLLPSQWQCIVFTRGKEKNQKSEKKEKSQQEKQSEGGR